MKADVQKLLALSVNYPNMGFPGLNGLRSKQNGAVLHSSFIVVITRQVILIYFTRAERLQKDSHQYPK